MVDHTGPSQTDRWSSTGRPPVGQDGQDGQVAGLRSYPNLRRGVVKCKKKLTHRWPGLGYSELPVAMGAAVAKPA
jgi:hypothetical protein